MKSHRYFLQLLLPLLLLHLSLTPVLAQIVTPVKFSAKLKMLDDGSGEIVFTGTIDKGWHVYSTDLGADGPIAATFNTVRMDGVKLNGRLKAVGRELKTFDRMFAMELRFFEGSVTFVQKVRFTKPTYAIDCFLEYGACNDQSCLPPSTCEFRQQGNSPSKSTPTATPAATPTATPAATSTATPTAVNGTASNGAAVAGKHTLESDTATACGGDAPISRLKADAAPSTDGGGVLWQPVTAELKAMGDSNDTGSHTLLYILLAGFAGGLLAVCMPCIWPVIPMTVSFFMKRAVTDRRKGVRDAVGYGISIIVIYLALGLLVTAVFGSDTLNALSTNAVFNIILFLLLVLFALSFFGWFELRLPSSWADKTDRKSEQLSAKPADDSRLSALHSSLAIFFMAFTLVLVSFSCTAPIIGLLLVETVTTGNWTAPAVGMFGFALALALPFTLFALFPTWLKQVPRSGRWMTTIKTVLGFIELAFSLKFLSVADMAYGWHLLDREVFLSLWIVIFAMLGAYLCGWLHFRQDYEADNTQHAAAAMPVACIMGGMLSLAFAVYMLPGLWGAPCKAVSAFTPPMSTQDFNLNARSVEARFTDYEQGMAAARAEGKPVLLDFTGFGCVNCRKMEAAVWTDPTVAALLTGDVVLVSLYVDDKTPLATPMETEGPDGQPKTLRTVGAKWSWLESHKFGANAQPFYVMVDPVSAKPLSASRAYDEDAAAFAAFLRNGLSEYQKSR